MATAPLDTGGGAGILSRLLEADESRLPPSASRWILGLKFSRADRRRMHDLAEKGQQDTLAATEEEELEDYRCVGLLLSSLKAKARKALKRGRQHR